MRCHRNRSVLYTLTGLCALGTILALGQSDSSGMNSLFLKQVAETSMPGPAVRFDYQSIDAEHGRLYISHMNADQLIVFDTVKREVIANLDGFKRIHGVLAVPDIGRVYASATGDHQLAVVDAATLKTIARVGPIDYPDGIAYAPNAQRVFVSDEHGNTDAVIDAKSNTPVTNIPLGGGAGNTVYDPGSGHILVAVHGKDEIAAIDPEKAKIIGRYKTTGAKEPHGIALDSANRLAFVAGEDNHTLVVIDLNTMKVVGAYQVGEDPDVLAFDPGLKLLYVSAESGNVTVFREIDRTLQLVSKFFMPHAHTVAVDPKTHFVYFPLENINGKPRLRIMAPSDLARAQ